MLVGAGTAVGARRRECVTDNHLGDQLIRSRREPEAHPEIDIEHTQLEIGHRKQQLLLLLKRQGVRYLAEVGIILSADVEVLAELAREPDGRGKIRFTIPSAGEIDDRIDDELPLLVAPADDRPHLDVEQRRREAGCAVGKFEVDAIEEIAIGRVRNNKQSPDLGAVREEVIAAKRLFARKGWPVIDVTRRSVEETAAKIINMVNDRTTVAEE